MRDKEYYRRIAEEAARETDQTSMDRTDMARILECLNEGGRAREHIQPDSIWCLSSSGVSEGHVEHKVVDILKSVGLINGEIQTVAYPKGGLEREHYSLSDTGRRYIARFGTYGKETYGEGDDPWVDIEELRDSIAKLEPRP